jgi:hypothetical protein
MIINATSNQGVSNDYGPAMFFAFTDTGVTGSEICAISAARSGADNSGRLQFGVRNAGTWDYDAMVVDADSNVGIGLKNPDSALHIADSGDCYITMTGGAADSNVAILFENSSGTQEAMVLYDTDDNNLKLDSDGDIWIDAGGENIKFYDDGTEIGQLDLGSQNFTIRSSVSNKDTIFRGNDGGSDMESMRIDYADGGRLGMNTTGPNARLHIHETTNGQECIFLNHSDTSADQTYLQFRHDGTQRGNIQVNNTTDQIVYNVTTSDKRLKKDFEAWDEDVLPSFKSLKPQLFNFIHSENNGGKRKGYIAQDNVDNFPEAYSKSKVVDGDDTKYYQFNPSGMVSYLMKAVKELTEKVEALENA